MGSIYDGKAERQWAGVAGSCRRLVFARQQQQQAEAEAWGKAGDPDAPRRPWESRVLGRSGRQPREADLRISWLACSSHGTSGLPAFLSACQDHLPSAPCLPLCTAPECANRGTGALQLLLNTVGPHALVSSCVCAGEGGAQPG